MEDLKDQLLSAIRLTGTDPRDDQIIMVDRGIPHKPRTLPSGKMGVYSFVYQGQFQPFMSDKVQILPIDYEGTKTLYVLNVINVVDCLDYEKSKIRRFSDGTVSEIDEFAFDYSKVSQHDIFKIPEKIWSTVFVSDKFKATVEENGLIGFKFTEVWDSDEKAVQERKRRYQEKLAEIRRIYGPEYTFDEAIKLLDQGKAFVSDQWKLQKNKKGDIVLGRLVESTCEYLFLVVVYYPPILITYKWKETEPSDV